ncbi:MAG: hypothetical protein P4M00_17155 [Azospirillaceae bacterium]|nr:hypothetical protein [Azospirillaceae bacterium]
MPDRRSIFDSGYARVPHDFYATPAWVTETLARSVALRGPIWEPCCGTGAITEVLERHDHQVVSTDIADRGFGTAGIDFFSCRAMPEGCRALITNPPYGDSGTHQGQNRSPSAMLDFLRHALALAEPVRGQVALLVRFQWIAGKRAAALMSAAPFTAVVVLTQRIRWFDMGEDTKNAQHHHAWVFFDYETPPGRPPVMLFGE